MFTVESTTPPAAAVPANQWSRPGPAISRPGPPVSRPGLPHLPARTAELPEGAAEARSLSPSPPGFTAGKVYDPNSTDELQEWDERNNLEWAERNN